MITISLANHLDRNERSLLTDISNARDCYFRSNSTAMDQSSEIIGEIVLLPKENIKEKHCVEVSYLQLYCECTFSSIFISKPRIGICSRRN